MKESHGHVCESSEKPFSHLAKGLNSQQLFALSGTLFERLFELHNLVSTHQI